jgi:glycosyltransferase involved in cell wall biosynthesis
MKLALGKRRVAHLTSVHLPFDNRIFHKECRSLAEAGYEVTLLAPHDRDEVVDGVRIAALPRPRNRLQRMTQVAQAAYRRARRLRAHLYHLHDPELLPWGLLLQRMTGAPVIYDAHEYVAMDVAEKHWLGPFRKYLGRAADVVEKGIAGRLAGVVAVNPHMAGLFRAVAGNVAVVANFPRRALAEAPATDPPPDTVVYVGGMDHIRGYSLVIEAMRRVRRRKPAAVCRLVGDLDRDGLPPEYADLSPDDLRRGGVERVDRVPYASVPALIAGHAVGWVPWKVCTGNLLGTPTKLLEYMALARPVVASDLPFVTRIVKEHGCGIVVPSDSPEAHAEALLHLFDHPDEARAMGESGRRAVRERLNWECQASALFELYASCLAGKADARGGGGPPDLPARTAERPASQGSGV